MECGSARLTVACVTVMVILLSAGLWVGASPVNRSPVNPHAAIPAVKMERMVSPTSALLRSEYPSNVARSSLSMRSSSSGPYVKESLVLVSNTLVPGNVDAANGVSPYAVAYDSKKNEVFVANSESSSVTVISQATSTVLAVIFVGGTPEGIAFDSGKGEIFVGGASTVSVISDATNTVVAAIPVGMAPDGIAYDSGKGEVFVANWGSASVSVISDATNMVVSTISVGLGPDAIAYDSHNGEVMIANFASDNVSVISDATNKVTTTIPMWYFPRGVAYDSEKREFFVSFSRCQNVSAGLMCGNGSLSVISDSNNTVVATALVGGSTSGETYDSGKGEVFVSNTAMTAVSVVSDANNSVAATIWLEHLNAVGLAYAGNDSEVFAANEYTDFLSVISDNTNEVVANISLDRGPTGMAYDSARGEIFVSDYNSNDVFVISTVSNTVVATIPVGINPFGIAYDSGKGEVFVACYGSSTVDVISDSNNTVVATIQIGEAFAVAYDSGKNEIFVAHGYDVSVISDSNNSVVATLVISAGSGTVAYDNAKGEVFATNGTNVSVISDTNNSFVAHISGVSANGMAYDSEKGEVFVTDGSTSDVDVISDESNMVVARVPVGSAPYAAAYDSANGEVFVTNFNSDELSVISDATNEVIATVVAVSSSFGAVYDPINGYIYASSFNLGTISIISTSGGYSVSFVENGLPSNMLWSVTLANFTLASLSSSISFAEPNGTYVYTLGEVSGWTTSNFTGSVNVIGGAIMVANYWVPATFAVVFTDVGLPLGINWFVTLNGTLHNSTGTTIEFAEENGTYAYTIGRIPGWETFDLAGSVSVIGAAVTVTITWYQVIYPVEFTETGLPSGTNWSVMLSGMELSSKTSTIVFEEPNGSYVYQVGSVNNYASSPSFGTFTVSGGEMNKTIVFSYKPTFLGLPGLEGYYMIAIVFAIVIVVVALVPLRLRSRSKPAKESPPPDKDESPSETEAEETPKDEA